MDIDQIISPAMKRALIGAVQAACDDDAVVTSSHLNTTKALIRHGLAEWKTLQFAGKPRQRAVLTGLGREVAARLIKQENARAPKCTCGALEYNGCFCCISLSDFLASGPNRRI